jgi:hypothetical protein
VPGNAETSERRVGHRAKWDGRALFNLSSHVISCTGINLSEGGICFTGPWLARKGQAVGMKLMLFDREVQALGRVAWVRRERGQTVGGIEFTKIPPQGSEVLESYIRGMGTGAAQA